jgi:pyridoxal phosphate enzyme (YggS family)
VSSDVQRRLEQNLSRVRGQIAEAAVRSNRSPEDVRLVAVTKYVSAEIAGMLVELGCHDLGESRPQALWDKAVALAGRGAVWHLIGHLQRNKVRRTLPNLGWLHSLDSLRLVEAVAREAEELGIRVRCLLEVNISGDPAKHGWSPEGLRRAIDTWKPQPSMEVVGLMAMAGLEGDRQQARREFAALRELRDALAERCPLGMALQELSMGMSGDFAEAIAEGATMVRVGSALLEGLE